MFLSIVSLVECDGQVGGPRRDVATVVLTLEVDEVHAPVGERPGLVEGGRAGDDVEDSTARIHQREVGSKPQHPAATSAGSSVISSEVPAWMTWTPANASAASMPVMGVPDVRATRVSARGHDDCDGGVLAPDGGGHLRERASGRRVQDGGERRVKALKDHLGFRVAETHVEFDDADPLRSHREATVQEASEGGAAPGHLGDDGLGDLVDDALRCFLRQPRERTVGTHATRVRTLVAIAHALEVLRGLQRDDGGTIGETEQRDLGAVEVVLDNNRSPVARQARARVGRGLGAVGGHDRPPCQRPGHHPSQRRGHQGHRRQPQPVPWWCR